MTLLQLKYSVCVAKKGSITEAAKELFISQPSLTAAIKELEKEIQISIFRRTNKGVEVTTEGEEFLGYARQVMEQNSLLEERYLCSKPSNYRFSVSTQHYSFAVNAFVDVIHKYGEESYDFTLRETKTYEIIEDVSKMKSEIGILYLNEFNSPVIKKLLKERNLDFVELFVAKPHVFISSKHILSNKKKIRLEELQPYPYLSFEQGEYNSFYFAEEILSVLEHKKSIKVSDRATLFNLLIGLDGYTVCTGILSEALNGKDIISVPLDIDETMKIGYIVHRNTMLSRLGSYYIETLKQKVVT